MVALGLSAITPTLSGSVSITAEDQGQQFVLKNSQGMEVKQASYEARITALKVPDRSGTLADVVLEYDAIESDKTAAKSPCFGATLGRNAGRIAAGRFVLDRVPYVLETNNGPHHNHGGVGDSIR
jgi:aldose 1-epimerase